jgi:hypothetical protein
MLRVWGEGFAETVRKRGLIWRRRRGMGKWKVIPAQAGI